MKTRILINRILLIILSSSLSIGSYCVAETTDHKKLAVEPEAELDFDGDGVSDNSDDCPYEYGETIFNGCTHLKPTSEAVYLDITKPSADQDGGKLKVRGFTLTLKAYPRFTNWNGSMTPALKDDFNEWWFKSKDGSWFFALPDGSFYLWSGLSSGQESVQQLGDFLGLIPLHELYNLQNSTKFKNVTIREVPVNPTEVNAIHLPVENLLYHSNFDNWFGSNNKDEANDLNELWFSSGNQWFFATEEGALYEWKGEKRSLHNKKMLKTKKPMGYINPLYYKKPDLLVAHNVSTLLLSGNKFNAKYSGFAPPPKDPIYFFLKPSGSYNNSGRSPEAPFRSLDSVHKAILEMEPNQDVVVKIFPGVYEDQSIDWTYSNPDLRIYFTAEDPNDRPIFDGSKLDLKNSNGAFFWLKSTSGNSNLIFDGLVVKNYQWGISLKGDRSDYTKYNGSNVIQNCRFERIGNYHYPQKRYSTSAIGLVNSHLNIIANNEFIDVRNFTKSEHGYLHTIYGVSSHYNLIYGNRLINSNGSPFHFRDYANENIVVGNYLQNSGYQEYTEWYCHEKRGVECSKKKIECASWGNQVLGNSKGLAYDNLEYRVARFAFEDDHKSCTPPAPGLPRSIINGRSYNKKNQLS